MSSVTTQRRMPTVIVARTVAPGREREFERWLKRLTAAARKAPGYLDAEVQKPNELHPNEWVVVYQFDDAGRLADWLRSSERAELMAEGVDLQEGPPREQVVALTPYAYPVTAVTSVRVRPGNEEAHRALYGELKALVETREGFLRVELFEPVEGIQDDTVVVFAFDSREHLDAWLRSDERRAVLEQMQPYLEGSRSLTVVGGFAGWFPHAGERRPKRWKQATVVLLGLLPTTLTLGALREALLPDVNFVLGVILGNVVGVALLTWVLMPVLTRLFDGWLRR